MIPFVPVQTPLAPLVRAQSSFHLGQGRSPFRVVVTDAQGVPFRGATVLTLTRTVLSAKTDSAGVASFDGDALEAEIPKSAGRQIVQVRVTIGDLETQREGPLDETLFVQIPVCAPQPFLTTPELISFALGSALVGAGLYWKVNPLQIVGEVLFGAAVFTAVYRHSCSS